MKSKTHLFTFVISLVFFAVLSLHSCGGNKGASNVEFSVNTSQPQTTEVTYEMLKKEVLDPHCISCHSDIATEEGLMKWVTPGNPEASLLFTAVENGSMPKNQPPLGTKDLELIRSYIIQLSPPTTTGGGSSGGGTSGGTTGGTTGGGSGGISYEEFKANVLIPYRCVNCHSVGTEAKLAKWINTSNPSSSLLYTTMKNGSMPRGGPRADNATLDYVLQYINDFVDRQTP